MHSMHRTRSLGFGIVFALLTLATPLAAQTPQWKPFSSSTDGFSALFPSEPELTRNNVPVGSTTYELHSYVTEAGGTALYVGVCDYGASGVAADPTEMLAGAKKGAVEHMSAHLLSEKKISLDTAHGVAFEAESDKLHITARIYMAGGVLYQTMVASPLNEAYADAARFLDSFQLLPRPAAPAAAAAKPPEGASYRYGADGFSAWFPSRPASDKQNVSTAAGTFELRTYVAQDASTTLIAAVCDYGATLTGKDPDVVLDGAKNGAITNVKAKLTSEKKITLGSNRGVEFEADNDTAHISARIYLVGATLYQTMVAAPLNARYADTARFLDSFELLPKAAAH
ncbi:MAG TPA: hypothetical protein VN776_15550 [Terracidiphilus sp.]|nr:hypothetical protein [Terracidiphilus sp.]